MTQIPNRERLIPRVLSWCGVFLGVSLLSYFFLISSSYQFKWERMAGFHQSFLRGWLVTLGISAAALILSTFIGLALTLGQRSPLLPLRQLCRLYVEIIRGTPLLVQIYIAYYIIFTQIGIDDKYLGGIVVLSAFAGAYLSEIFRAGIESIGRTQIDSARAIGLTTGQTYRWVIFPQAIRQTLPAVAGQFSNLIKDSSLLSIIGVGEFTKQAEQANVTNFLTFEAYFPLAIGYLMLTLPISALSRYLEERYAFQR